MQQSVCCIGHSRLTKIQDVLVHAKACSVAEGAHSTVKLKLTVICT